MRYFLSFLETIKGEIESLLFSNIYHCAHMYALGLPESKVQTIGKDLSHRFPPIIVSEFLLLAKARNP